MSDAFRSFFGPQPLPDTFFNRAYADLTGAPVETGSPEGDASRTADPNTTGDIQLAMKAVRPRPTAPAQTPKERAQVILGETAGLYPKSLDAQKRHDDPNNWVEGSEDDLATARKYVGIVAGRNWNTHPADPEDAIPGDQRAWELATEAAKAAHENPDTLDPRIFQFYIRHEGDPFRPFPGSDHYFAMGPFRNIGGQRSAGADNNTFIEFYGKKR